jgi:hypothetical protein
VHSIPNQNTVKFWQIFHEHSVLKHPLHIKSILPAFAKCILFNARSEMYYRKQGKVNKIRRNISRKHGS